MIILGIETSCDETSIALLEAEKEKAAFFIQPIRSVVSSQIKIHAPYGGVVPTLAAREHVKNLDYLFNQVLPFEQKLKFKKIIKQLDLIAVTEGPGLIPALLVGINFAKALAWGLKKPLIGINHLEAHLLSFLLGEEGQKQEFKIKDLNKMFPAIGLIVSGGHTLLLLVKKIGDYQIIGETRDDAAGECFDKTSRILGLGYPGGPAIAQEAELYQSNPLNNEINNLPSLPRPMINSKDFDFSFSGLKTAVLYTYQKLSKSQKRKYKSYLAYEIENAITDVLVEKTIKAARTYQAKSIILGGGVTANKKLREKFSQITKVNKLNLYVPLLKYTTDNAMMVAGAAFFNFINNPHNDYSWNNLIGNANLIL